MKMMVAIKHVYIGPRTVQATPMAGKKHVGISEELGC